jgi:serine/threonine protein kinase
MAPERWQQIEKLFHSALEREPAERAAFLIRACGGDESLRRAVESLLAHHEQANSFIEAPATTVAAAIFEDEKAESLAGQAIGRYEVVELLGAGGMGEVYLAQDTTLGRKVALKLLPALYTKDVERLRRFEQEARTASALNHPNIVTIYEIGQVDETHFIATEYLDGATLRAHLKTRQIRTSEALDIAVQVASALAGAHAKGVVHRDIKPENIMVLKESYSLHRENYVKVLDFGIAKLTEASTLETEAPTKPLISTNQGVVLGTASYMSPEQARGSEVDARTDIWSLGVVLYEMLIGKIPFDGETAEDVRAAILKDKLPPLSAEVPERLKWIVEKALRKDREDRYQTAREFFSDLRELQQQEFASDALREHSVSAEASARVSVSSDQAAIAPNPEQTGRTQQIAVPATSSAEYIVTEIKRHKRGALLALAAFVIAATGIAFAIYQWRPWTSANFAAPFQTIQVTKLTNTGNATNAAMSPDSKYVAYVINEAGQQSLWVRHISTSSNVQIIPPEAEADYSSLTFSPDGGYVYYLKEKKNELTAVLYQVPVLGGVNPKKIVVDVDGSIAFSPDGKQIAFVRLTTKEESYLMVAKSDGTEVRTLATRKLPSGFIPAAPAWSPDAKAIFCAIIIKNGNDTYGSVVKLRVADGTEETSTSQRWSGIRGLSRLRDGGLIVAGDGQLWYLSHPDGNARNITNDSNEYRGVSVSEDSSMLVTIQFGGLLLNIWVESFDKGGGDARQITTKVGNNGGPGWTPDGKIVYTSNASGNFDIWIMDQGGANPRQLTANQGQNWYSTLTADGRYIVFLSDRSGSTHIWRMDNDGGNPKQLTNGNGETWPYCSPDGKWVVYVSTVQSKPMLWKVPLDGGDAIQLTDKFSGGPAISPDGKLVACVYFDEGVNVPAKLAIIPIEGGPPVKMFELPPSAVQPYEPARLGYLRWASDGSAVTYVDTRGGVSNIRSQPLDGRPPKQITDFKSDRIFFFDWSRDGKRLALARGARVNDVVLISDSTNQQ